MSGVSGGLERIDEEGEVVVGGGGDDDGLRYREVEEVGEDGEDEVARALRREAMREKMDADEIHELIRKNQVPVGTGEKLAHEAGEKEWTHDDQVELDRLLREDSDEFLVKEEDSRWLRKKGSQSEVVMGVTRLSSEPRLKSRRELLEGERGGVVGGGVVASEEMGEGMGEGMGMGGNTVVTQTTTMMETREVERMQIPGMDRPVETVTDVTTTAKEVDVDGVPIGGAVVQDSMTMTREMDSSELPGGYGATTMGGEGYTETSGMDSRDMAKIGAATGVGAAAGAATGAYLVGDEDDTIGREVGREYERDDTAGREVEPEYERDGTTGREVEREYEREGDEMERPAKGALMLKDEVVPQRYTSTYTDYHSKMGAHVDVTHDYGLSGGHTSGVEDVVFLDADSLITAGTDGKVCIWDLNERYVKTEFEPYEDAEPVSMIQLMPSGAGTKGITFLTLSKNTRVMRIWNVVGDNAILMRSMQIPASKNDLVMSLPVFSPSQEVYPTES